MLAVLVLGAIPDGIMVFYDGTSVPAGWQVVATFDGRFPRACTPTGSAGGSEYHTHDYIFGFTGYPTDMVVRNGLGGGSGADDLHDHDIWGGDTYCHIDSAYHVPPYRKFLVIKKVGEGGILPAGAVLFFEDSVFSSSWQVILRDSFPRGTANTAEVGETGGVNGHYHTFEGWTSEPFQGTSGSEGSYPVSSISHRHHYTGYTLEDTTKPPYILWFIAELTADTDDIPIGAIAMFDYEPSGSPEIGTWVVPVSLDTIGGDTAKRFPRGARLSSQLGQTGGSTYHRHGIANLQMDGDTSTPSDLCYGSGDCDDYYYSEEFAEYGHSHYLNLSDYHTDYAFSVLPPYRCVLFRKKVSSVYVGQTGGTLKGKIRLLGMLLVLEGFAGQEVRLYSASGQLLLKRTLRFEKEALRLRYPSGVYILRVGSLTRKLVLR